MTAMFNFVICIRTRRRTAVNQQSHMLSVFGTTTAATAQRKQKRRRRGFRVYHCSTVYSERARSPPRPDPVMQQQ